MSQSYLSTSFKHCCFVEKMSPTTNLLYVNNQSIKSYEFSVSMIQQGWLSTEARYIRSSNSPSFAKPITLYLFSSNQAAKNIIFQVIIFCWGRGLGGWENGGGGLNFILRIATSLFKVACITGSRSPIFIDNHAK